jgi:deazaflavin-dependent oxidoreductase (nitroreductase family)
MRGVVGRLSRGFTTIERRMQQAGRRTIGGWVAGGVPVLLLTTTGRRSGRTRTTPLLYHRSDDGSLLLVAVNGAADWNPDWLHNLTVNPLTSVEIDGSAHQVLALVLDDGDRAAVWDEACRAFPGLEPAQAVCTRQIPIIRLTTPGSDVNC